MANVSRQDLIKAASSTVHIISKLMVCDFFSPLLLALMTADYFETAALIDGA